MASRSARNSPTFRAARGEGLRRKYTLRAWRRHFPHPRQAVPARKKSCHGEVIYTRDSTASVDVLDSMVTTRRTDLWHIVLTQELLAAENLHVSPFLVPLDSESRFPHHTLCHPSKSTLLLQYIRISPFTIPTNLANTLPSSAPKTLTYLWNRRCLHTGPGASFIKLYSS